MSRTAVLDANRDAALARLKDEALVLDVGAGGSPFPRADWVIDLMPIERRGFYNYSAAPADEHFDEATWVVRDICSHEPWPFADRQFDFVVCSHTLEDVRDPVWVCHEMARVGKAGYIEVPSRLEEQSYGVQGPWVGWGHHRWLIDIEGDEIQFVFKHHIVHGRESDHFDSDFYAALSAEQRVQWLWWENNFRYREWVHLGPETIDPYLADYVAARRPPPASRRRRAVRRVTRSMRSLIRA